MSDSWALADGPLQLPDVVNAINAVPGTGRKALGSLVLFAAADDDCTVNGVQALGQPDFGKDGERQPAGASCSSESTSA